MNCENSEINIASMPRCVIVIDKELPIGHSANAAAVMALTVGQRYPTLIGESYMDASGTLHHGLVTTGVPVLGAEKEELQKIRHEAVRLGCDVIDLPIEGQQTTDYAAFREAVGTVVAPHYLGIALVGQKKPINKVVGRLKLLK